MVMLELTDEEKGVVASQISLRLSVAASNSNDKSLPEPIRDGFKHSASVCRSIIDKLNTQELPRTYFVELSCGHTSWVSKSDLNEMYCGKCGGMMGIVR